MSGYNAATAFYGTTCMISLVVIALYAGTLRRIIREKRWRDMWLALGIVIGFTGTAINTSLWGVLRAVSPFSTTSGSWWAVAVGLASMLCLSFAGLCHVRAHAVASGWQGVTFMLLVSSLGALWLVLVGVIAATGLGSP